MVDNKIIRDQCSHAATQSSLNCRNVIYVRCYWKGKKESGKLSTGNVSARIIVTVVSNVFPSVKHMYISTCYSVWYKQGSVDTEARYLIQISSDKKIPSFSNTESDHKPPGAKKIYEGINRVTSGCTGKGYCPSSRRVWPSHWTTGILVGRDLGRSRSPTSSSGQGCCPHCVTSGFG